MAIIFPASIPAQDLAKPGSGYDADKINRYDALYKAGDAFRALIDEFLTKRKIEEDGGSAHYTERKKNAAYIPRGAGLIDWLTAAVFKDEPRIVTACATCSAGTPPTVDAQGISTPGTTGTRTTTSKCICPKCGTKVAPEHEFWLNLNENCDGRGHSFPEVCRDGLREILIQHRAYFAVDFIYEESQAADRESFDAMISCLCAAPVDDWQFDSQGRLQWIRRHTSELVRPTAAWEQPTQERHCWTFFADDAVAVYEATRPIDQSYWKADDVARLTTKNEETGQNEPTDIPNYHDFGQSPAFDISAPFGTWVMERLYDTLKLTFNAECRLEFALNAGAYPAKVFTLDDQTAVDKVTISPLAALRLSSNKQEKYEVIGPGADSYKALFDDVERLKLALYECLQSLSLNAQATQTQNARQSATAKVIDNDPLKTLLASMAWPIKGAMTRVVRALQTYRNEEDLDIELDGFNDFTATLADAQKMLAPGAPQNTDPEARPSAAPPKVDVKQVADSVLAGER